MGLDELLAEHVQVAALLPLCEGALAKPPHQSPPPSAAAPPSPWTGRYRRTLPPMDGSSRRGRRRTWRCRVTPDVVVLDAGRQARR
jgi:hypothetical protein